MDQWLDILGFVTGILYLYWEYHANPKMWIAELVMPLIMIWLFLDKGLYGDCAMNAYYFFIAIYGYIVWTKTKTPSTTDLGSRSDQDSCPDNAKKKQSSPRKISHISLKALFGCLIALGVIYAFIAWALIKFTDSNVPYLDAFTTALSMVAMWMLARKYVEQWIAWIIVDIVSCGLYIYKEIPWSATRYGIYVVIAVFGYAKWKKLMARQ